MDHRSGEAAQENQQPADHLEADHRRHKARRPPAQFRRRRQAAYGVFASPYGIRRILPVRAREEESSDSGRGHAASGRSGSWGEKVLGILRLRRHVSGARQQRDGGDGFATGEAGSAARARAVPSRSPTEGGEEGADACVQAHAQPSGRASLQALRVANREL